MPLAKLTLAVKRLAPQSDMVLVDRVAATRFRHLRVATARLLRRM
jgi:hypothetical protein